MTSRRRPGGGRGRPGELDLFESTDAAPPAAPPAPPSAPPPAGAAAVPGAPARAGRANRSASLAHGVAPAPELASELASLEESIPGASAASAIRVSTLTATAKDVLEGAFMPLWVRGEVSDFKAHRNGHWYFCLRDESSQIRCVVWARDQRRIPAPPDDGMQVVALGQLTVYAARGDMQFSIKSLEAQGDGLWRKAMEQTRLRLEQDGLLALERKRAIPRVPRRVAVVTSPDGAALHDIVAVARRRNPAVELVVVPAKVQGDGAPEELCAALERVGRWGGADVVIIGRGGGAREDLWAFNDERLARAVAACPTPVISAVGHEIDITICDLVADLRAPTPSAAAEAAIPVRDELLAALRQAGRDLAAAAEGRVAEARARLRDAGAAVARAAQRTTERRRARVETLAGRLGALSPLATLARGYAVARAEDGSTLTSVAAFRPETPFTLLLRDGTVHAVTSAVLPQSGGASDAPSTGPQSPVPGS